MQETALGQSVKQSAGTGVPLAVPRSPVALCIYALGLFMLGAPQAIGNVLRGLKLSDWTCFWIAGRAVGTRALVEPPLYQGLQLAQGFAPTVWLYPPAFALVFLPVSHLSLFISYTINIITMLALAAFSGIVLASVFAMPRWFGVATAIAWSPIKVAAVSGQNSSVALALISATILAARNESPLTLGLAVGLLLYKPTIGFVFLAVLVLHRQWRALSIVVLCAGGWYVLSVVATGGDWLWVPHYARALHFDYAADTARNLSKAVSLPGMLMNIGVPTIAALGAGAALFLIAIPRLAWADLVGALCFASLLAVAVSPHAWQYEAAIALPAIFYVMKSVREPIRTLTVVAAYVIAAASVFHFPGINWQLLLIPILAGTAGLLFAGLNGRLAREVGKSRR